MGLKSYLLSKLWSENVGCKFNVKSFLLSQLSKLENQRELGTS